MAIVTEAFRNTYQRQFEPEVQQRVSKLMGAVQVETGIDKVAGERHFIDFVGTRTMTQVEGRAGDSPHTAQDYRRRAMTMTDYHDGIIHDSFDKFRLLEDPQSEVVMEQRTAAARKIDDVIIENMIGTAYGDHTGSTGYDWATYGTDIPVHYNEALISGTTGATADLNLTVGKVRRTAELFRANDVDLEYEDMHFVIAGSQLHALQVDDEWTSADYNAMKPLIDGKAPSSWMGFTWHVSNRLNTGLVSGYAEGDPADVTARLCFAYARSVFKLGFALKPKVILDPERIDKRGAPYSYISMTLGGVRKDEKRVLRVPCYESAALY